MADLYIRPGVVRGSCLVPPSKSETQRALLLAAFADGVSFIKNPLLSPDTKRLLTTFNEMGVSVVFCENTLTIKGIGKEPKSFPKQIDCGNSGILLRFLTAIAATFSQKITFTGDSSLKNFRSCRSLLSALQTLGVKVSYLGKEGFAPFTVQGPMQSGEVTIEGSDSQPVSALLLASAISAVPVDIHVSNPGETPWVEMTLSWLKFLGVSFKRQGYSYFSVEPKSHLSSFSYTVPRDLSTAAFPAAAAIVSRGAVFLEEVNLLSRQGDSLLFSFFEQMGAKIISKANGVFVQAPLVLEGIEVDANNCIDAVPILSAVAASAASPTTITNIEMARNKECDRLSTVAKEWKTLGIFVKESKDSLTIFPKKPSGGITHSHQDHRIAMSLAVLGLFAENEVCVQDVCCLKKTFSGFAEALTKLGASCAIC